MKFIEIIFSYFRLNKVPFSKNPLLNSLLKNSYRQKLGILSKNDEHCLAPSSSSNSHAFDGFANKLFSFFLSVVELSKICFFICRIDFSTNIMSKTKEQMS